MSKKRIVNRKKWKEFRDTGLLGFTNMILHIFGWVIVFDYDDNNNLTIYPARTKFRGFDEKTTGEIYEMVTNYLVDNIKELKEEVEND